ncbi:flagella synthesis protein FlgN [Psychromonas sp. KJ10-10]|uniref:flagella synthesis protein FlgN n=1 Tax=Psychromonas sp. KJ10-10 TaxID=3391823 RepID=UPI0039B54A10
MLQDKLSQQLQHIQDLQVILEEEKRCLTEKDFSTFSEILFNKQKVLQTISTLDQQLTTQQNLSEIAQSPALNEIKSALEIQLKNCQKVNAINGKLVALSMKSNKHFLQLMTQATGKNSVTYDQKGSLNSGKLLGKNIQA